MIASGLSHPEAAAGSSTIPLGLARVRVGVPFELFTRVRRSTLRDSLFCRAAGFPLTGNSVGLKGHCLDGAPFIVQSKRGECALLFRCPLIAALVSIAYSALYRMSSERCKQVLLPALASQSTGTIFVTTRPSTMWYLQFCNHVFCLPTALPCPFEQLFPSSAIASQISFGGHACNLGTCLRYTLVAFQGISAPLAHTRCRQLTC